MRRATTIKTVKPMNKRKTTRVENMCTRDEVYDKFYELGFKSIFIKALLGTEPTHVWEYYKSEYTVQHVVDEIINNIEKKKY